MSKMKVLFRNARGIANTGTQLALCNICGKHKPNVLFISEHMVDVYTILTRFWKLCGLKIFATNDRSL